MKRIVGKIAVFVLVGIFMFPFFVPSIAKAATATFPQSSWSGGTSANTVNNSNKSGWNKFSSSSGVTAGANIHLATTPSSVTQTTDDDFYQGRFSNTEVDGTGTEAAVRLTSGAGLGHNFATFPKNTMSRPYSVAVDTVHNKVYFADSENNRIEEIDSGSGGTTLGGNFTYFGTAGSGEGQFRGPIGVYVDSVKNKLYVADGDNYRIDVMDSGSGGTTLGENFNSFGEEGGGDGQFEYPGSLYVDSVNNKLYVADYDNYRIDVMDNGSNGTTLGANFVSFGGTYGSGDGEFEYPEGIFVDVAHNKIYVTDADNYRIDVMDSGGGGTTLGGNFTTFGEEGSGSGQFETPSSAYVDSAHNKLYVTDYDQVDVMDSGSGGTTLGDNFSSFGAFGSDSGQFNDSRGIFVDTASNKIYVADTDNYRIDKMDSGGGGTTLGNNFTDFGEHGYESGQLAGAFDVAVDTINNKAYVGESGTVVEMDSGGGGTTLGDNQVLFGTEGSGDGQFAGGIRVAIDPASNKLYVLDMLNSRIVVMDSGGGGTTLGGNFSSFGSYGSSDGEFEYPRGFYVDTANNKIYVVDTNNSRITEMDSGSGGTTLGDNFTAFGSEGSGNGEFEQAEGIYIDVANKKLYVADTDNNRIIEMDSGSGGTTLGNNFTTFGSEGSGNGYFEYPSDVYVDSINNKIYVTDTFNNRIDEMDSGSGGTTLGDNFNSFGAYGSDNGQFSSPEGIFVDDTNNKVYIADTDNKRIVEMDSGSAGVTYDTFGVFTSGVIYTGTAINSNISWSETGSPAVSMKVRSGTNSADAATKDWSNCEQVLSAEDISSGNCSNPGDKYVQYQATFSSTGASTASLNDVTIGYDAIPADANLVSSWFNSGSAENKIARVQWSATTGAGSAVKAQIQTAPDNSGAPGTPSAWLGPDSTAGTTLGANFTAFGSDGSDDGQFSRPTGIFTDTVNNKIYVADSNNNRIVEMDSGSGGTTLGDNFTTFGTYGSGDDQFSWPEFIFIDAAHNKAYVTDNDNDRIVEMDSGAGGTTLGGNFASFGTLGSDDGQFHYPEGIYVDSAHNKIYVSDGDNFRIDVMDSGTGGTTLGDNFTTFGSEGSDTNQFEYPVGIALDTATNKLYIADDDNHRVIEMDSGSGGTTLGDNFTSFGTYGSGDGQFHYPNGISLDNIKNKIYITDYRNSRIVEMDSGAGGTTLGDNFTSFGTYGSGDGQFERPIGVYVDTVNNKIAVADYNGSRIVEMDSDSGKMFTHSDGSDVISGSLAQENNNQWFRYKLNLTSGGASLPSVSGATITYDAPLVVSPVNSLITGTPAPITAGHPETVTLTAYDTNGDPYSSGGDTVIVSVSGANTATPSVTDNSDGTYTATYTPANAGTDMIASTLNGVAVGHDTDGTSDGTFHLTVNEVLPPSLVVSPANSSLSGTPAPITAGNTETVTLTAYDTNDNLFTAGGDTLVIQVNGANTSTPSVTDNGNGTYTAIYTPANSGIDLITATLNGTTVGKDTDGTSDGTFHLTVNAAGTPPTPPTPPQPEEKNADYLYLKGRAKDSLTFAARISSGKTRNTDDITQGDGQTRLRKVTLEARDHKTILGKFQVETLSKSPEKVKLTDTYKSCSVYRYLFISPDGTKFSNDEIERTKLRFNISKDWLVQNKITTVSFFRSDSSSTKLLESKKFTSSNYNQIYDVSSAELLGDWTIVGCPAPKVDTAPGIITPSVIETPTNNDQVSDTPPVDQNTNQGQTSDNRPADVAVPVLAKEKQTTFAWTKLPKLPNSAPFIPAALLLLSFLPLLTTLNSAKDLPFLLRQSSPFFFGILGKRKKDRMDWGIVYDVDTGKPIPLATVSIIDDTSGKIKETKLSDKNGAYYFLTTPGTFHIDLDKQGYTPFPITDFSLVPVAYEPVFDFKPFTLKEADKVALRLSMKKGEKFSWVSFFDQSWLAAFLKLIFWLGLALDIFITIISPTPLNIIILIVYIYLGFLRNIFWGQAKWGKIIDAAGKLQPFSSIKLFKKGSLGSVLVARTISDEAGRYFLIAEPGHYVLEVASASGIGEAVIACKKDITVKERSSIKEALVLG